MPPLRSYLKIFFYKIAVNKVVNFVDAHILQKLPGFGEMEVQGVNIMAVRVQDQTTALFFDRLAEV